MKTSNLIDFIDDVITWFFAILMLTFLIPCAFGYMIWEGLLAWAKKQDEPMGSLELRWKMRRTNNG